jgi:hypothetical protein
VGGRESEIDEWALFSSFELRGYGLTALRYDYGVKGRLCVVVVQLEAPRCCWLLLYVSSIHENLQERSRPESRVSTVEVCRQGFTKKKTKGIVGKLSSEVPWLG